MSPVLGAIRPARWSVVMTDDHVPPHVKKVAVVAVTAEAAKMRADRHERELGSSFRAAGASELPWEPAS